MKQRNKRLTILLDSEVKELYSLPTLTLEQKRLSFLLNDLEMDALASIKDRHLKTYFIILLGYFKIKPIVLNFTFKDVKDDFYFALAEYFPSISLRPLNLTPSQKSRLYRHIFSVTGFTPLNNFNRHKLINKATEIAKISNEPRYIFDELISFMATNYIVIPKYSQLQRVIIQVVNEEKNRFNQIIKKYSSKGLMDFTNSLLTVNSTTPLSLIKRKAKDFSLNEIQKEVAACELISPLIKSIDSFIKQLDISKHNVEHYASLVDYYTVTKLRRFHESTSSLYLLCYLQQRFRELNEHLCDAFIYHCRKLTEKSKDYAKETAYKEWKNSASNVTLAGEILALFIDNNYSDKTEFGVVKKKAFSLVKITDIEPLCRYLKNQQLADDDYRWQYYDSQFADIIETSRPLFLNLTFSHSEQSPSLLSHICSFKKFLLGDKDSMPFDRRIIPHKMLPYVVSGDQINQERYEVMLYLLIKDKIEDHLLFVENTFKYTGIRDDLVPDARWKDKDTLIEDSGLDRIQSPPNPLLDDLQTELTHRLSQVSHKINEDNDTDVIMQHRGGKRLWRLPYKGKQKLVNNPFFEKLRSTHIADVLRLVHEKTNILSAFEHVSGKRAADALTTQYLIAANIANGTNYGLYKMAQISDCSYDQLKTIQANHLRLETLSDANDMISNAISKLPIFKHYSLQEGVIHASADGQKFESRMSTFKTRYSSKYFGTEKGVSAITLVANHVPINAQVIGANEHESHYIF